MPKPHVRAPHILQRQLSDAACRRGWCRRLAAEKVYVAPRLGRLRISPHVYNDEEDVERFLAAFRRDIHCSWPDNV